MLGSVANLWRRWVVSPVVGLLKMGADPRRLAWSLALGLVVGVNPLLGSTTLVALAAASALRLNLVASQVGNHAVYPLEWLLFPVFIKVGSMAFGTPGLPLGGKALLDRVTRHPLETTRLLWMWEWHALLVWAVFAAVAMPLLALGMCPVLAKMKLRIRG